MFLRFARWWAILLGGVLLGAGLCLHGQLAVAAQMRAEVDNTFFLWRGIGRLTFVYQGDVTKAALWLHEIPERVMRESDRGAWALVVIGALISLSAPLLRSGRGRKPKKKTKPAGRR